jgi:hypothetical protein
MIQHIHDITGATNLYAVISNASGQRWRLGSTNAFENFTVSNWSQYRITLSESPASSFRYSASIPSGIRRGSLLTIYVYEQVGGSPLVSDTLLATAEVRPNENGFLVPLTIEDSTGRIIHGCEVIVTSTNTSDKNDIVAQGYSNGSGRVEFPLETGTYYLWRQKRSYRFDDPMTFVVNGEGAVTFP